MPIDITRRVEAMFDMIEVCKQFGIAGMVAQGTPYKEACKKWGELKLERFLRKNQRPVSFRYGLKVGLWRGRRPGAT